MGAHAGRHAHWGPALQAWHQRSRVATIPQVHGTLDYAALLHPNGVRSMLADITASKHIFTNADAKHTAVCLERLGIEGCFEVGCFTVQPARPSVFGRCGSGGAQMACLCSTR